MGQIRVIGLGALNVDYLYRVERILVDGEAVALDMTVAPGGSAANTIYALARLRVSTGFVGTVGDDPDGRLLLADFKKAGVDVGQIKTKAGARTGAVLALSDRLGRRSLYVSPGANDLLRAEDVDTAYLEQADFVHISSFAGERQFRLCLDIVGRLGHSVKLGFAPGALYVSKGIEALAPILRKTYVLFVNQKEIRELTGQELAAATQTCLNLGCRMVAVTLGKGLRLPVADGDGRVTRGGLHSRRHRRLGHRTARPCARPGRRCHRGRRCLCGRVPLRPAQRQRS